MRKIQLVTMVVEGPSMKKSLKTAYGDHVKFFYPYNSLGPSRIYLSPSQRAGETVIGPLTNNRKSKPITRPLTSNLERKQTSVFTESEKSKSFLTEGRSPDRPLIIHFEES